jgi:hypothetical protein
MRQRWPGYPRPDGNVPDKERVNKLDRAAMTAREEAALIMQDWATSFWLRDAMKSLLERDPVDALHDAEALVELMRKNLKDIQSTGRG